MNFHTNQIVWEFVWWLRARGRTRALAGPSGSCGSSCGGGHTGESGGVRERPPLSRGIGSRDRRCGARIAGIGSQTTAAGFSGPWGTRVGVPGFQRRKSAVWGGTALPGLPAAPPASWCSSDKEQPLETATRNIETTPRAPLGGGHGGVPIQHSSGVTPGHDRFSSTNTPLFRHALGVRTGKRSDQQFYHQSEHLVSEQVLRLA